MQYFPVSCAGQGPHSSGLEASIPVRKVFPSSGASGQKESWSLEGWDGAVLLYGSWCSLAAAGSAPTTNTGMGLSHCSSGVPGTETLAGKNKVPIISFSLSLYPMHQDSYSDKNEV